MPLLVAAAHSGGKLSLLQAGWIATAYMTGQLAATFALPLLKLKALTRTQACMSAIAVVGGLAVSALGTAPWIPVAWLVVGLGCGAFQFLGATTAALSSNKSAAFAIRLATVLLVSAAAILYLRVRSQLNDYEQIMLGLATPFLAIVIGGLALYRPPRQTAQVQPVRTERPIGLPASGLVVVFLVFVGQPGFWAYAVSSASARGISVENVALAIAAAKALSGAVLMWSAFVDHSAPEGGLLIPGVFVVCALLLMTAAPNFYSFLAGLLLWELALNKLSARLQAAVVRHDSTSAGAWMSAAIFLGAAVGPLLHGLAIDASVDHLFVIYACSSALIPAIWSSRAFAKNTRKPVQG